MKNIKNVVFDLGGVLLNIDYWRTIQAFKDIGIDQFDALYTQAQQSSLFDDFEKGLIDEATFLLGLQAYLPNHIENKKLIQAWNAMLLDLPVERLEFVKKVRNKYRTALLSNTNTTHLESFQQTLQTEHQLSRLDNHFDFVFFSCDLKLRKPDVEIFQELSKQTGFVPEETLFIDDSIQHVEGAKKAGFQAVFLDVEKTDVITLLAFLLA